MKISLSFLLAVAVFVSAEFCNGQSRTNINWRGINHQSGRHNTNINLRNVNYNYRGNRWRTSLQHNFWSRQTNLNANYRRNHNFNVGHNWQNRQTNVGYTWNFGKRRRSIEAEQEMDYLKPEDDPRVFLEKLTLFVEQFVQSHRAGIPELASLSVIPNSDLTSNITVAKEIVCLVRKLQRILPRSLGNFIVKMIKFHGPSFNINDLGDFFEVDPMVEDGEEFDFDEHPCKIPDILNESKQKLIDSAELLEVKKFTASLIMIAMEYQQMLEQE